MSKQEREAVFLTVCVGCILAVVAGSLLGLDGPFVLVFAGVAIAARKKLVFPNAKLKLDELPK